MADSTEVTGAALAEISRRADAINAEHRREAWQAGYAAALEDVDAQAKREGMGVIVEWVAQPMATARLAWRRRSMNEGAS
jgi:hypothetical protein